MSACHCEPCGRDFSGLTAFDKHQDVNYGRRPAVACLDPASVGLVQQASGRWGFPVSEDSREALRNLRARQAMAGTSGTPRSQGPAESRTEAPS